MLDSIRHSLACRYPYTGGRDLSFKVEKVGRPHTLVVTNSQQYYEMRLREWERKRQEGRIKIHSGLKWAEATVNQALFATQECVPTSQNSGQSASRSNAGKQKTVEVSDSDNAARIAKKKKAVVVNLTGEDGA